MGRDWVIGHWGKSVPALEKVAVSSCHVGFAPQNPSPKPGSTTLKFSCSLLFELSTLLAGSVTAFLTLITWRWPRCLAHSRQSIYFGWGNEKINACVLVPVHAPLKSQWTEISVRQERPEPRKTSSHVAQVSTGRAWPGVGWDNWA